MLHQLCLDFVDLSDFAEFQKAILCGQRLSHSPKKTLLLESGLMHLIVVSGSHLVFLSEILTRLRLKNTKLHFVCLGLYVLICQAQAPCLRSFVFWCIEKLSEKHNLHLARFYLHLFPIFVCLMLFPSWVDSISFQLSILASVGLQLSKNHFLQCLWIHLMLYPLLSFYELSVSSLWSNIIFSPLIGALLFPLALFFSILQWEEAIHWMWRTFFHLLEFSLPYFQFSHIPWLKLNYFYSIWFYLCAFLVLLRKKSSFSSSSSL